MPNPVAGPSPTGGIESEGQMRSDTMAYAHRNGEAATPTEPGLYWFSGGKWGKAAAGMLHIVREGGILMWYPLGDEMRIPYEGLETFVGRWWGPVTPPWGDTNETD